MTSAATSISSSLIKSSPVISQSTQTRRSIVAISRLPVPLVLSLLRRGLGAYTGTHLTSQPEPAQVSSPIVTAATARGANALTALITSGPARLPRSLQTLHPPRNCARFCGGEASAPRVRTMPEEMPLPRPISAATRPTLVAPVVSGNNMKPSPSTIMVGTATYTRPKRSMMRHRDRTAGCPTRLRSRRSRAVVAASMPMDSAHSGTMDWRVARAAEMTRTPMPSVSRIRRCSASTEMTDRWRDCRRVAVAGWSPGYVGQECGEDGGGDAHNGRERVRAADAPSRDDRLQR